ncbi:MAG: hypothetical protein MK135_11835, partial [Polyangiaceae bacterium]|nr:hypothetical protein [Polyangiaceae bacterium]
MGSLIGISSLKAFSLLHRYVFLLTAVFCFSTLGVDAQARTIGETVDKHVNRELKKKQKEGKSKRRQEEREARKKRKKKDAEEKKRKAKEKKSQNAEEKQAVEVNSDQRTKPARKKPEGDVDDIGIRLSTKPPSQTYKPPRVLGKWIQLDPQVGIGYRGWVSDQYPALKIKTASYFLWSIGLRGRFFKAIKLYRAFYKSTGLKSPRRKGAVIAVKAAKAAPNAAAKALAFIGIPIRFELIPLVRYETRSYEATAVPVDPVRIIPFEASENDDVNQYALTTESLSAISTFETLVVGLRYNDKLIAQAEAEGRTPMIPLYFGVGLTQYSKPYQVRVGDSVLDELVFNSRFRGAGLSLGVDYPGGINRLLLSVNADVGLGEIRLTQDLTLNEVLSSDWL